MWSKSHFNVEVIVICLLSFIGSGPSVFKISCSRDSARVVRKIVQSKWIPILDKYQVKFPVECPFHPMRDIFGPQQAAKKQHRQSQWTCGFCGKSFFEEKYLDAHFENRHKSNINMAEDAVCFADYCDIMRCEVLIAKDATLGDPNVSNTDMEVWTGAYRTALITSGPRDLAKLPPRNIFKSATGKTVGNKDSPIPADSQHVSATQSSSLPTIQRHCKQIVSSESEHAAANDHSSSDTSEEKKSTGSDEDGEESDSNTTSSCEKNLVDSSLPPANVDKRQQRIFELQKMKANCKSEELEKLQIRCEQLVRDCIVGLLVDLSDQQFRDMEEELNRAVCWYLTCDRYWEDGPPDPRDFPWGLVFVLVMVLSLGVCFCYYIIWVLFDTDDQSLPSASPGRSARLASSNANIVYQYHQNLYGQSNHHHHQQASAQQHQQPQQQHQQQQQNLGIPTNTGHCSQQNIGSLSSTVVGAVAGSTTTSAATISANSSSITAQSPPPPPSPPAGYSEEYLAATGDYNELGQSEHYIYVTYPPELKRRLLESCYNRTTRL